eukprot:TRINITY_DN18289_c0_g1_i4.p1 TRINITY_DN18289_c0_g1~~TRINITY_DN18289_c0_g1_i4.p1  ORF type:complete len:518 (+),score=101.24 TRINITY_DN18289_c0_g1_i4:133-1686(+)
MGWGADMFKGQATYTRNNRREPKPLHLRCANQGTEPNPEPSKPRPKKRATKQELVDERTLREMRRYYDEVDMEELAEAPSSDEGEEISAHRSERREGEYDRSKEIATWKQRYKLKRDQIKTAMHAELFRMRSEERLDPSEDSSEPATPALLGEITNSSSLSDMVSHIEIPGCDTHQDSIDEDAPGTPVHELSDVEGVCQLNNVSESPLGDDDKENLQPPTTPKQAFDILRNRRHKKLNKGAQHFSQQQLLAALQAMGSDDAGSTRQRSNSWDQKTVNRTMQRWSSEKQRKASEADDKRTAGAKFWRKLKSSQVLDKFKSFQLITRMEKRAQAAPKLAAAQWKAEELERNFGGWLRASRSLRERSAQIGGESLELWRRSDRAWNKNMSLREWQSTVVEQLKLLTYTSSNREPTEQTESALMTTVPDDLLTRILLTSGHGAMCRAAATCQELYAYVAAPYMWHLLARLRWGSFDLSLVEKQLGWKYAYIRRDRMAQMSTDERQEIKAQNQQLFVQILEN